MIFFKKNSARKFFNHEDNEQRKDRDRKGNEIHSLRLFRNYTSRMLKREKIRIYAVGHSLLPRITKKLRLPYEKIPQ